MMRFHACVIVAFTLVAGTAAIGAPGPSGPRMRAPRPTGPSMGSPRTAGPAKAPEVEADQGPKVVHLTVDPAPESVPALKYQLRIQLKDQTPGNAALFYQEATRFAVVQDDRDKVQEKVREGLKEPVETLSSFEFAGLLSDQEPLLRRVHLAARCGQCDWDFPWWSAPHLASTIWLTGGYMDVIDLVALKTRTELRRGEFDAAIEDLQTGFAMIHHLACAPSGFQQGTAQSIARKMSGQVVAWIRTPKAPNLYWALTDLPVPLIDTRETLAGDQAALYFAVPGLRNLNEKRSIQEWERIANQTCYWLSMDNDEPSEWSHSDRQAFAMVSLRLYPQAKKDLIAAGHSPEEVEAMPVQQVMLTAAFNRYCCIRDELFKWFSLPYWQGRQGLDAAIERLEREQKTAMKAYPPFYALVGCLFRNLDSRYYSTARQDRTIAAMRCIEAIRMCAASNGGQLPSSLGQITAVPLPIDPLTGKEFGYRLEGDQATLIAPRPDHKPLSDEIHYVITLRKP